MCLNQIKALIKQRSKFDGAIWRGPRSGSYHSEGRTRSSYHNEGRTRSDEGAAGAHCLRTHIDYSFANGYAAHPKYSGQQRNNEPAKHCNYSARLHLTKAVHDC